MEYWQSTDGGDNWSKIRELADVDDNARFTRIQGHLGCVWNDSHRGVYAYMDDEWETEDRLLQEVSELAFPFTGYFIIYNSAGGSIGRFPGAGNWTDIWAGDIYRLDFGVGGVGGSMAAKLIGAGLL